MESTMSAATETAYHARAHRPRRVAIRTALRWNLIPLALLFAGIFAAWTQTDDTENWALLAMLVLLVWGGGALIVSAGLGAAFAAALMRGPQPRSDGVYGHTVTTRSAVRLGGMAAVLGWVLTIVAVVVMTVVSRTLSGTL
jgi:hypothetical protein